MWNQLRRLKTIRLAALRGNSLISRLQIQKDINYFGVTLKIPSRHPLEKMLQSGHRESTLRILSKHVFSPAKNHYVDIGAHVGDTPALIETFAGLPLRSDLVEPSEFFFRYLAFNSRLLNDPTLHKKFAATSFPAEPLVGEFHHWTGNAEIVPLGHNLIASAESQVNLSTLVGESTALVKVDCEGLDLKILNAAFQSGMAGSPVIYFECTIRTEEDLEDLKTLLKFLENHWRKVIITDPSGISILSDPSFSQVLELARYQLLLGKIGLQQNLYYFDLAFFPIGSESEWLETIRESTLLNQ